MKDRATRKTLRVKLHALVAAILLLACGDNATAPIVVESRPVPCLSTGSICTERIAIGTSLYLPVFSTHSLYEGNNEVTRGLIIVHGSGRSADVSFRRGFQAAEAVGVQRRTVVASPHFQTSSDGPSADEPFWSSGGWKRGSLSSPDGPRPRVSSYTAIDKIVELLSDPSRFPALTEIVMTGHSAGGQVAHRYAAASRAEENFGAVSFRYVVANPSTYLYLRAEREVDSIFVAPDVSGCPGYDDWHYGLQSPYNYATVVGVDTIRAQLIRRDVRILIGSADTLSAQLDVSCGANLQGRHRFERGQTLVRFMDWLSSLHRHQEMIVPGSGHSSSGMYLSAVGLDALFGT